MKKMTYKEKFVQMNKEAKASWIVTAIIIAFWWLGGYGVYQVWGADWKIFSMPAWFLIGTCGTWILAMVLVTVLVKKIFRNFDLDDGAPVVDVSHRDEEGGRKQ